MMRPAARLAFVVLLTLTPTFTGAAARSRTADVTPSSQASTGAPADAELIALEQAALARWGTGDPDGFLGLYAPDVTYFDPMQERRVDGLPAITALVAPLRGKLRIDRFEMVNPKVQRHGDVAVLAYNLVNYQKQPDGSERATRRWHSTAVFRHIEGRWRTIHAHWSFTAPPQSQK